MRLGKTLVAIRWVEQKPDTKRILVLCPAPVVPVWLSELELEGLHGVALVGSTEQKTQVLDDNPNERWYITNYETTLWRNEKKTQLSPILQMGWDTMILDESTRIRNTRTKTFKLLRTATRLNRTKYRAILSGLPNPEGPMDFFGQMCWTYDHWMHYDNFWAWRKRFFEQDFFGYEWLPRDGTRARVREVVHDQAFVMSRHEAGIGERQIFSPRYVTMPPWLQQSYAELIQTYRLEDAETKWKVVVMNWASQLAGGYPSAFAEQDSSHKMDELVNLLTGELAMEQVVVWFRYNRELKVAKETLTRADINCGSILGATKHADRVRIRDCFQEHQHQVLLVQLQVGKYGLDFSAADTAVYYSNSFSFEARAQSMDRIVHPTKKRPLLYIDLLTEHTFDPYVLAALRTKGMNAKRFLKRLENDWEKHRGEFT
jgi:SNF2 family DNA or RNA helicase